MVSSPEKNTAPVIDRMIRYLMDHVDRPTALLAVCPNSDAVTRAALLAAREANAPLLFAATLNQVDLDGGYTHRTPGELVSFIEESAEEIGYEGLTLPCLDHGGPWLKDTHTSGEYSYDETMSAVKRSLEACLDAGYALLHIDPTVDRTLPEGEPIPIELVIERTAELIEHAEAYRQRKEYPPISYEVGTEEVHGGLANLENFEAFLEGLDRALTDRSLEHAWPCFVVGKVGTDLHTSYFEPEMARKLTARTSDYGALIKGHYTDYVENPEDYPLSGMGGANVGPEFTEEEYKALMELLALEKKVGKQSGLKQALVNAVVSSGRWEKWLRPAEKDKAFAELDESRREWLVRTGSRYIWTQPAVQEARDRLYDNLAPYRNADRFVLWQIKESIMKYFHAFNLIDFNDVVRSQFSAMPGRGST